MVLANRKIRTKQIGELKNIITRTESSVDGLNRRMEKESFNGLENRIKEITQLKEKRKQMEKKKKKRTELSKP